MDDLKDEGRLIGKDDDLKLIKIDWLMSKLPFIVIK